MTTRYHHSVLSALFGYLSLLNSFAETLNSQELLLEAASRCSIWKVQEGWDLRMVHDLWTSQSVHRSSVAFSSESTKAGSVSSFRKPPHPALTVWTPQGPPSPSPYCVDSPGKCLSTPYLVTAAQTGRRKQQCPHNQAGTSCKDSQTLVCTLRTQPKTLRTHTSNTKNSSRWWPLPTVPCWRRTCSSFYHTISWKTENSGLFLTS